MMMMKPIPTNEHNPLSRRTDTQQCDVWYLVQDTSKADEILNKKPAMYLLD